jgi:glycogen debranching enzyme
MGTLQGGHAVPTTQPEDRVNFDICAPSPSPGDAGTAPGPALVRRMRWPADDDAGTEPLLTREWLVTNGLGGYAGGTVAGVITRRYHGLLVAALPAPHGRTVMLNQLAETLKLGDRRRVALGGEERVGSAPTLHGAEFLREFGLEAGLPTWRFEVDGCVLEKRLILSHGQNTVYVTYTVWCWRPTSSSSRRRAASRTPPGPAAAGDEVRTVIAGYHWFTDWGRDTMISLEGLTLTTGRHARPATSCAPSPTTCATG